MYSSPFAWVYLDKNKEYQGVKNLVIYSIRESLKAVKWVPAFHAMASLISFGYPKNHHHRKVAISLTSFKRGRIT